MLVRFCDICGEELKKAPSMRNGDIYVSDSEISYTIERRLKKQGTETIGDLCAKCLLEELKNIIKIEGEADER